MKSEIPDESETKDKSIWNREIESDDKLRSPFESENGGRHGARNVEPGWMQQEWGG